MKPGTAGWLLELSELIRGEFFGQWQAHIKRYDERFLNHSKKLNMRQFLTSKYLSICKYHSQDDGDFTSYIYHKGDSLPII